jgi:hypothetical protein
MTLTRKIVAAATVMAATLALFAGTAKAGTAKAGGVTPFSGSVEAGGVRTGGQFCDRSFEDVSHAQYIINPGTFGSTVCMRFYGRDQEDATGFTVTSYAGRAGGVNAFPEVFGGYQWGRHPVRSFEPVPAWASGRPRISVAWSGLPGHAHPGIDMWFNKTDPADPYLLRQNNGAEIMVWFTGHRTWNPPYITIDHGRYNLTWWETYHHGVHWPLIIFAYAGGPKHFLNGDLKPFMTYAAAHTPMRMGMWLTSIAFGAELFSDSQLSGYTVHDFSLTGITTAGSQSATATVSRVARARYVARARRTVATGVSVMVRSATVTAAVLGHSADWRTLRAQARADAAAQAALKAEARAQAAARADAKARALAILRQKLAPRVPGLKGMWLMGALRRLHAAGYRTVAPRSVRGRILHVTRLSPAAGTPLAQGKTVRVFAG